MPGLRKIKHKSRMGFKATKATRGQHEDHVLQMVDRKRQPDKLTRQFNRRRKS